MKDSLNFNSEYQISNEEEFHQISPLVLFKQKSSFLQGRKKQNMWKEISQNILKEVPNRIKINTKKIQPFKNEIASYNLIPSPTEKYSKQSPKFQNKVNDKNNSFEKSGEEIQVNNNIRRKSCQCCKCGQLTSKEKKMIFIPFKTQQQIRKRKRQQTFRQYQFRKSVFSPNNKQMTCNSSLWKGLFRKQESPIQQKKFESEQEQENNESQNLNFNQNLQIVTPASKFQIKFTEEKRQSITHKNKQNCQIKLAVPTQDDESPNNFDLSAFVSESENTYFPAQSNSPNVKRKTKKQLTLQMRKPFFNEFTPILSTTSTSIKTTSKQQQYSEMIKNQGKFKSCQSFSKIYQQSINSIVEIAVGNNCSKAFLQNRQNKIVQKGKIYPYQERNQISPIRHRFTSPKLLEQLNKKILPTILPKLKK